MFSRTTTMSMSSGPLFRIGVSTPGIEADGTKVDVLVEVEPEPEQDPLLEDSRRDVGMAHGAQQDGVAGAEPADRRLGQDLAGRQIPLAPQVEPLEFVLQAVKLCHIFKYRKAFCDHLGADAVARNHADLEQPSLRIWPAIVV